MMADGLGPFGTLLQQQRRAAGLSQAELGERAGLSRRGISDLERGERRRPYPATVRRLVEALGLEGTQRAALLAAVRQQTPAERIPEPAPAAPSADGPERLGRSSARATLPRPLTSFVGRERELGDVRRLLGITQLLTLTGTGGVGKTRLAVALACALEADEETAVAFVELAPLADPQLVTQTVGDGASSGAVGYTLDGRWCSARSAREVMAKVFRELAERDPGFLERFAALPKHGSKRRYLARTREELYPASPHLADNAVELRPGWWIDAHASRAGIGRRIRMACEVAGVAYGEDLTVNLG